MNLNRFSICSLILASIATVTIPSVAAQDRLFSNEAKQKAEALLKQMTLDEKIGQLNEPSGIVMPGIETEKPDDLIADEQRLGLREALCRLRRCRGGRDYDSVCVPEELMENVYLVPFHAAEASSSRMNLLSAAW